MKSASRILLLSSALLVLPSSLPAATEPHLLALTDSTLPTPALTKALPKVLAAPIITVVDKAKPSPTGDPHDYVSYARYYWPDPTKPDGLPFISKDGFHNREQVAAGDRDKVDQLVDNVVVLALGWSRLHREDCAKRAGDWLRAWFVTPATRMKPGLDYAQVRLGHNHNLGNNSGVLDTRDFSEVIGVVALLKDSPALSAADQQAMHAWFEEFFTWLKTAPSGKGEYEAKNNHGSWYLVQTVAIAHYLGHDDEARKYCEGDKARIAAQFAPDGAQAEEIARQDGLHYSYFNLVAQLRLAVQARALGVDLWHYTAPNGGSLKQGLAYIRPYNAKPETWPHREKEVKEPGFMDDLFALAAKLDALPALQK